MSGAPTRSGQRYPLRRVLPELERRYRESGWWTDETLGSLVSRQLAAHPAATVAIWSRARAWRGRYADIDDEARRLVSLLRDLGVEPGETVAFQLPNWREAVVCFVALALGGYVLVPIVHIYGRKEVSFILAQSGAAAYISPRSFGHVDYDAILASAAPATLRAHVVVADDEVAESRAGLARVGWSACARRKPARDLPNVQSDELAVLAYTSGTTSDPKGVIHDHRTLLSELRHMAEYMVPGEPKLMGSPVAHATGMLGAVLGPLATGEDIHLIDRWDPAHVLEVMLAAKVGSGSGAPVFLSSLLDHPDFKPEHAARMRHVGLGGASVPVALGERAATHGISIVRAYGSTEHPSTTGCRFADSADHRHRTDGQALAGVELRLVDESGVDVPVGTPGEILSRGPDLCLGYTDPALTAEAFDADGWYHSGDVGVLDADGFLTITDRLKDIIIRGGANISAAEIEQALQTLPGVAEVAVVAAPDVRLGEHACAVVRMQPGAAPVTLTDVTAQLARAELSRSKWPEELRIVADFPRTASGKIRKVDLRAWLRAESGASAR